MEKKRGSGLKLIAIIWTCVFVILAAIFIIGQVLASDTASEPNLIIQPSTFQTISITIAFATFIMTTFFSFVIYNHNKTMRDLSEQNYKRSCETEARADEFRKLQFVSTNYSVVEFTDNMLLYEQYKQYTTALRANKSFNWYLRESETDLKDVAENFDNYIFLTVKIPFKTVEGKATAAIRISRFKFTKDERQYRFVPCSSGVNTLILHDEESGNDFVTVNLIVKKDNEFYTSSEVVPFKSIKLNLTMYSILGVAVTGWTELYFTNPRKLEKNGANQYKIISSQFKISGLPELVGKMEEEV